jgi:hypothetical protein
MIHFLRKFIVVWCALDKTVCNLFCLFFLGLFTDILNRSDDTASNDLMMGQ